MIWRYRAIRFWEWLVEWGQEGLEWAYEPPGTMGKFLRLAAICLALEGILALWVMGALSPHV